ncbi:MAG: hypothetical protein LBI72_08955 [Flavobacteriaceae bacterium]|jgi:DNA-binding NarL/FixJ family response regulator|nr:hypothetical protein [Flavobacteriaceae bacterium]
MIIYIIDDHPIVREGYSIVLQTIYPHATIVTSCLDEYSSSYLAAYNKIDCFIISYKLKKRNTHYSLEDSLQIAKDCKKLFPLSKLVLITAHEEMLLLYHAHKSLKPDGFLLKNDITKDILVQAIQHVVFNESYYSQGIIDSLKDVSKRKVLQQDYNIHILILLSQGYKIREIGEIMSVSEGMVQKRIVVMKEEFKLQESRGLVREARLFGFI